MLICRGNEEADGFLRGFTRNDHGGGLLYLYN